MPYRSHSRSRGVWYGVLAAAAVVGVLALIYFVGTHRSGDEDAYEPPATLHDHASDASDGQPRGQGDRHRGDDRGKPEGNDGPAWFDTLPLGPGVSPGPHQASISVTTGAGAAVGVKYAFRTGDGVDSGITSATSSWSSSSTVSGGEPLAGVIAQVASGTVSCTVRIDGHVTSHRTSSGEYATVTCAG